MDVKDCARFLRKLDVIEAALNRGNEAMVYEQIRRFRHALVCTYAKGIPPSDSFPCHRSTTPQPSRVEQPETDT